MSLPLAGQGIWGPGIGCGEEGRTAGCFQPRAAVASLPCPGLYCMALTGPKAPPRAALNHPPVSSTEDVGHTEGRVTGVDNVHCATHTSIRLREYHGGIYAMNY